jgi:hypothetical protein
VVLTLLGRWDSTVSCVCSTIVSLSTLLNKVKGHH